MVRQEPPIPQKLLHGVRVFHGKTDAPPSPAPDQNKDPIATGSPDVPGKPGVQIARTVNAPLPAEQRRMHHFDPRDRLGRDRLGTEGEVLVPEQKGVAADFHQAIGIYNLGHAHTLQQNGVKPQGAVRAPAAMVGVSVRLFGTAADKTESRPKMPWHPLIHAWDRG